MKITQSLIKSLFDYTNGFLYSKTKRGKSCIGYKAGWLQKYNSGDRFMLTVNYKKYFLHRLIFLWHHGYMPNIVDHINKNQLDNRIENLREANNSQNMKNRTSAKNSSSKYLGVCRKTSRTKWEARITVDRKLKHLGCFVTENEAALAYNEAAKIHHGEFANLNIILTNEQERKQASC